MEMSKNLIEYSRIANSLERAIGSRDSGWIEDIRTDLIGFERDMNEKSEPQYKDLDKVLFDRIDYFYKTIGARAA